MSTWNIWKVWWEVGPLSGAPSIRGHILRSMGLGSSCIAGAPVDLWKTMDAQLFPIPTESRLPAMGGLVLSTLFFGSRGDSDTRKRGLRLLVAAASQTLWAHKTDLPKGAPSSWTENPLSSPHCRLRTAQANLPKHFPTKLLPAAHGEEVVVRVAGRCCLREIQGWCFLHLRCLALHYMVSFVFPFLIFSFLFKKRNEKEQKKRECRYLKMLLCRRNRMVLFFKKFEKKFIEK